MHRVLLSLLLLSACGPKDGGATEASVGVTAPPKRKAGQKVKSVEELFEKLTKEAKIL